MMTTTMTLFIVLFNRHYAQNVVKRQVVAHIHRLSNFREHESQWLSRGHMGQDFVYFLAPL